MPDPNDGFHLTDPEDPDVCLSLDGQIRYNDICECGTVTDLRRYRGEWMCSACRDETIQEDEDDEFRDGLYDDEDDPGEWSPFFAQGYD